MNYNCVSSDGRTVNVDDVIMQDGVVTVRHTEGALVLLRGIVTYLSLMHIQITAEEPVRSGTGELPPTWKIEIIYD